MNFLALNITFYIEFFKKNKIEEYCIIITKIMKLTIFFTFCATFDEISTFFETYQNTITNIYKKNHNIHEFSTAIKEFLDFKSKKDFTSADFEFDISYRSYSKVTRSTDKGFDLICSKVKSLLYKDIEDKIKENVMNISKVFNLGSSMDHEAALLFIHLNFTQNTVTLIENITEEKILSFLKIIQSRLEYNLFDNKFLTMFLKTFSMELERLFMLDDLVEYEIECLHVLKNFV